MERILITTGNGMFGRAVTNCLLKMDVNVRIMVRDRSKISISHPNAEIVTGDLDQPESLKPIFEGVDRVFLSSPMDSKLAEREATVIRLSKEAGVKHIVKIFGAVKHQGDELNVSHGEALDSLKNSGIAWTLISPNSVMETSLLNYAPSIKFMHRIYGMSGNGKVGLVSLEDCAEAAATALTGPVELHDKQNYELTGPESLDLYQVAEVFSKVLKAKIVYEDISEEEMTRMILKYDKTMSKENIEIQLLCHLRAWKKGQADLVTDTFEKLTGRKPRSLEDFINSRPDDFIKGVMPGFFAMIFRKVM